MELHCIEKNPGFVSIGYGETCRHGNDVMRRRFVLQIPRYRRHGMSCRTTQGSTKVSQEAEGTGDSTAQSLYWGSHGRKWTRPGRYACKHRTVQLE